MRREKKGGTVGWKRGLITVLGGIRSLENPRDGGAWWAAICGVMLIKSLADADLASDDR